MEIRKATTFLNLLKHPDLEDSSGKVASVHFNVDHVQPGNVLLNIKPYLLVEKTLKYLINYRLSIRLRV